MSKGAPDYTKLVSLKGRDAAGNDVSVLVDSTGRILAVLQGAVEVTGTVNATPTTTVRQAQGHDGSQYRDLAVDTAGRMIALIKGSYGGVATTVSLDDDGNLNARLKGKYGTGLLDVAVDSLGRMVVIDVTNQKQTNRVRAALAGSNTTSIVLAGSTYKLSIFSSVDPAGKLTVTRVNDDAATKVQVTAETLIASKIYTTTEPLSDFSWDVDFSISSATASSIAHIVLVGDSVANPSFPAWGTNNGIGVRIGEVPTLTLEKFEAGSRTDAAAITIAFSTTYYLRLARSGTTATLSVFSDAARTQHVSGSPKTLTVVETAFTNLLLACNDLYANNNAHTYYVQMGDTGLTSATTGNISSAVLASTAALNKYWERVVMNLAKTGSTHASPFQVKLYGSADSYAAALNANWVTVPEAEYAALLLERPVVKTATSNAQTTWSFTSLTGGDALINELGAQYLLLLELAANGTDYVPLYLTADYTYNDTNRKAPVITLLSGTGIVTGTSKLRATMVVDVVGIDGATKNTSIKVQIQENRTATGEASPTIDVLAWDATKYLEAYYVSGYW